MNSPPANLLACSEGDTKPYRNSAFGFGSASHNSGALPLSMGIGFRCHALFVVRAKCHPDLKRYLARRGNRRDAGFVCADRVRTALVSVGTFAARCPPGPGAVRLLRRRNADPAARAAAPATDRPKRGAAISQPPARRAAAPARRGAAGRRAASRRWRQRQPRFSRVTPTSAAGLSAARLSASPARLWPAAADRPARPDRAGPGSPTAGGRAPAPMRSIPAVQPPTPPARRARSAAVRCRSQTKPRSVHRAVAVPVNRSISAPPARVIPAGALPPPGAAGGPPPRGPGPAPR